MNTYIRDENGRFAAIRASRHAVAKLNAITSGRWQIVPATRALRMLARIYGSDVPTLQILPDGRVGYL